MANSELYDMMSIGKHCCEQSCKQLDFLPFQCEFCKQEFCLSHRKPSKHGCRQVINKDSKLPQYPLCGKYLQKGSSDNDQVEQHIRSGCHSLHIEKRRKNRCSFSKCREINLIPLNCENCIQSFCVRHRHPSDHNCNNAIQQRLIAVH